MQVPFAGGAYKTFSPNINAQECVNFIPANDFGRKVLRGTPGLKLWCDTGKFAEVRGLGRLGGFLYAIVGNAVFRIDSDRTSTECTGTLDTSSGKISIAVNETQLMVVDGVSGYIVTDTTVTKITDDAFPTSPTSVTFQDGYFVITIGSSGQVYISDLNDGTSWDGTYYFTAEAKPDNALQVLSRRRNLVIFGEESIELWYNSGATVPFDRIPGTTQEVGIGASNSAVLLANTVYFLTNNFQVAVIEDRSPLVISAPAIDYQIAQYATKSDAIGMGITNIEGHIFYILTFPTANKTWGYDVVTKEWFNLTSYPEPFDNRWRGNCYSHFNDKHLVGDYENGIIYEWDFGTYTDNSKTIRRIRTAPEVRQEGKKLFHDELQIFFEAGVGLVTGQGSDPQTMLQWSDDGGHTWSNEYWRDIGKIGRYENRARWTRLGASRQRNYKLEISDPVKCIIFEANLEVRLGSS